MERYCFRLRLSHGQRFSNYSAPPSASRYPLIRVFLYRPLRRNPPPCDAFLSDFAEHSLSFRVFIAHPSVFWLLGRTREPWFPKPKSVPVTALTCCLGSKAGSLTDVITFWILSPRKKKKKSHFPPFFCKGYSLGCEEDIRSGVTQSCLFATPRTIAYQAPPSMGFSRQEYWSGLPFPSPEDLPQGLNPGLPHCSRRFYRLSHQGSL